MRKYTKIIAVSLLLAISQGCIVLSEKYSHPLLGTIELDFKYEPSKILNKIKDKLDKAKEE